MPAIDEFGGYSSRLRIPEALASSDKDHSICEQPRSHSLSAKMSANPKQECEDGIEESCAGANLNLCEMLGIDVENMALEIVEQDLA